MNLTLSLFQSLAAIVLSFSVIFVAMGMFFSFSEYYALLVEHLNSTYAIIGVIGTSVATISRISGPIGELLTKYISYKVVMIVASVLLPGAYFIASWDLDSVQFWFSYSLLFGISLGVLSRIIMLILKELDEEENVDNVYGVVTFGSAAGFMTIGCIAGYVAVVHEEYTWEELYRLFAIIGLGMLVLVIISCFFLSVGLGKAQNATERRPILGKENKEKPCCVAAAPNSPGGGLTPMETGEEDAENGMTIELHSRGISSEEEETVYGWALLWNGDADMIRLLVSNFVSFLMDLVPIQFALIYAYAVSGDIYMYYYVPLAMGLGMMSIPYLATNLIKGRVTVQIMHRFLLSLCGISCLILTYVPSSESWLCVVFLGLYAGFAASLYPILRLRTIAVLGKYQSEVNIDCQLIITGLAALLGGYTGGHLYDDAHEYQAVMFACAILFAVAFIFDEILFCGTASILNLCFIPRITP